MLIQLYKINYFILYLTFRFSLFPIAEYLLNKNYNELEDRSPFGRFDCTSLNGESANMYFEYHEWHCKKNKSSDNLLEFSFLNQPEKQVERKQSIKWKNSDDEGFISSIFHDLKLSEEEKEIEEVDADPDANAEREKYLQMSYFEIERLPPRKFREALTSRNPELNREKYSKWNFSHEKEKSLPTFRFRDLL